MGHCSAPDGSNGRGTGLSFYELSSHALLAGKATSASGLQALGASLESVVTLWRLWEVLYQPCLLVGAILEGMEWRKGRIPVERESTQLVPASPLVQVSLGQRDTQVLPGGELYRAGKEREKKTTRGRGGRKKQGEGVGRERQAEKWLKALSGPGQFQMLISDHCTIFLWRIRISASKAAGIIASIWEMPRALRGSQKPSMWTRDVTEELFGDGGSIGNHLER